MDLPISQDADGSAEPALSPSAPLTPSSTPKSTQKRRRTAASAADCCRTCRLRKVKCTGNPGEGPCSICARLELACSFVEEQATDSNGKVSRTTPSASHTEAGTLRKRAQRACNQCHLHKTKCSGDMPRCKRCESANLSCEYSATRRKFTNVRFQNPSPQAVDEAGSPNSPSSLTEDTPSNSNTAARIDYDAALATVSSLSAEELLNRRDFLLRNLDVYFEIYYWVPCMSFLHPKLTYQEVQNMAFHPIKGAAVCALVSFVMNPTEEGRELGNRCIGVVEGFVFGSINTFTEDSFFVTAMNTLWQILSGNFAKVWVCMGFLHRQMTGLRANWIKNDDPRSFIHQEMLRRLAWHVFYIDRLLADGYDEYISCRSEHMRIRLPCADEYFVEGQPVEADWLLDRPVMNSPTIGLHGWQLRIIDLRHRIQVLANKVAEPANISTLESSAVMTDINALQSELSRLHLSFPDDLKLTEQSLQHYMAAPERLGYVFLHSHVGVAHIDLYSFALPQLRESSLELLRKLPFEFVQQSQRQAVAHALSVARFTTAVYKEFCRLSPQARHQLAGDYSITHMATRAIRVLLVALEHELYTNIAAYTTAPPWSNGKADKAEIESLLRGLIEATEPWSSIYPVTKTTYDSNKKMIEDFFETRTFIDRKIETVGDARDLSIGGLGLDPPASERKLSKESSPSEPWQRQLTPAAPGSSGSSASLYSPPRASSETNYVAPAIPSFLEQVHRAATNGTHTWAMQEVSGLLPDKRDKKPSLSPRSNDRNSEG